MTALAAWVEKQLTRLIFQDPKIVRRREIIVLGMEELFDIGCVVEVALYSASSREWVLRRNLRRLSGPTNE